MTNRIQTLRSSVAGTVPTSGSRQPGELWLNFADQQLGYIDASKVAQKFLPVRFFSALANYGAGDVVWYSGVLYSANAAIPPGAFNVSQWTLIGGAGVGYLPLTGGNLSGALTLTAGNLGVSAGNISASGSGTFGSVTTVGLTATGAVTMNGAGATISLAPTGTGTVTINPATVGNMNNVAIGGTTPSTGAFSVLSTKGAASAYYCYDRGNSGGNTAQSFLMYRDANVGRLYMEPLGDVLQLATSGTATFNYQVNANGAFVSSGPASMFECMDRGGGGQAVGLFRSGTNGCLWMSDVGNMIYLTNNNTITMGSPTTFNTTVGINGNTTINAGTPLTLNGNGANYPLFLTNPSSQHCLASYTVNGIRAWMDGCWNNGSYYIYDASGGATRLTIDTGGLVTVPSPGRLVSGANGLWQAQNGAEFSPSPVNGSVGGMAVYGGTYGGGWAIYARTDAWNNYNMLLLQGTVANGSITTNGANAFFNTSCDARLKSNIRSLVSEIDVGGIIDALKPVAFEWNPVEFTTLDEPGFDDMDAEGNNFKRPTVKGNPVRLAAFTDYGFIAQDLYEVLPGIVHKPETDDLPMMADYSKIVPYLVAELQTLRQRVAQLEAA